MSNIKIPHWPVLRFYGDLNTVLHLGGYSRLEYVEEVGRYSGKIEHRHFVMKGALLFLVVEIDFDLGVTGGSKRLQETVDAIRAERVRQREARVQ